jgi:hypothetical protein
MVLHIPGKQGSLFLMTHLPLLLKRFTLFYEQDGSCLEYFLYSKEKNSRISKTLVVSHDSFSGSLYVAKFYPEIFREMNCKYLSAACFYLMAHHAAKLFHLTDNCCVNLETDLAVFNKFYGRLDDFNFKIHYHRPSEKVRLKGHYHEIGFGTDEILHHIPADDGE